MQPFLSTASKKTCLAVVAASVALLSACKGSHTDALINEVAAAPSAPASNTPVYFGDEYAAQQRALGSKPVEEPVAAY